MMKASSFAILVIFGVFFAITQAAPFEVLKDETDVAETNRQTKAFDKGDDNVERVDDETESDDWTFDEENFNSDESDKLFDWNENSFGRESKQNYGRESKQDEQRDTEEVALYDKVGIKIGRAEFADAGKIAIILNRGVGAECELSKRIKPGYENHGFVIGKAFDRNGIMIAEAFLEENNTVILKWNEGETFICGNWFKFTPDK